MIYGAVSFLREAKNGMVGPLSYVLAKTFLVLPIMFIFAIFALFAMGIPAYAIVGFEGDTFGLTILLWAAVMFVYECVAEWCLSVWVDDPILGMLQFMNFWFGSFLFAGFLIPLRDMFWPFELFYYIMPFSYYVRSSMYNFLENTTWSLCDPDDPAQVEASAVCVSPPTGKNVLGGLSLVYPVIDTDDTIWQDIGCLLAIAVVYKVIYVIGVVVKARKVTKFQQ
jgi:hypothetical protein